MTRRRAAGPPTVLPFFLNGEMRELGHLGTMALGAHWRLVYWVWSRDGQAPEDSDTLLARIVRVRPAQWRGIRAELLTVWRVDDGVWLHDRLLDTMSVADGKRRTNSRSGAAGGRAKALKSQGEHLANANHSPDERQPLPAQVDIFAGEPDELWAAAKGRAPDHLRTTWLDKVTLVCIDPDGTAHLTAPTAFVADRVNNQLSDDIRRAFGAIGRTVKSVSVSVGGLELAVVG